VCNSVTKKKKKTKKKIEETKNKNKTRNPQEIGKGTNTAPTQKKKQNQEAMSSTVVGVAAAGYNVLAANSSLPAVSYMFFVFLYFIKPPKN